MKKLKNMHSGEVLLHEFLIPTHINVCRLSKDLRISQTSISQIIKGKRRITANTALRLSSYFGNSPKFRLGLQNNFYIEEKELTLADTIESIKYTETKAKNETQQRMEHSYNNQASNKNTGKRKYYYAARTTPVAV